MDIDLRLIAWMVSRLVGTDRYLQRPFWIVDGHRSRTRKTLFIYYTFGLDGHTGSVGFLHRNVHFGSAPDKRDNDGLVKGQAFHGDQSIRPRVRRRNQNPSGAARNVLRLAEHDREIGVLLRNVLVFIRYPNLGIFRHGITVVICSFKLEVYQTRFLRLYNEVRRAIGVGGQIIRRDRSVDITIVLPDIVIRRNLQQLAGDRQSGRIESLSCDAY